MERLPELRKMKASSLKPELYDEISEFLSSLKTDLTISGKTSLYSIYSHLQGAKDRLRAKRLRQAEELIRAICAAADVREMRFGTVAPAEKARERKRFREPDQLSLKIKISREAEGKFMQLGITDRNAMSRILFMIGDEEFSRRHGLVLSALRENAYKPLFSKTPDLIATADFQHALYMIEMKVTILDGLQREGSNQNYTRNPELLLEPLHEIALRTGLSRKVDNLLSGGKIARIEPSEMAEIADRAGLRRPEGLIRFLKKIGFKITPLTEKSYTCTRIGPEGNMETLVLIDFGRTARCHDVTVSELFSQASMAQRLRAEAGLR